MICKSIGECLCMDLQLYDPDMTAWKAARLGLREARVLAVILMRISQFLSRKRVVWRIAPYVKRANEILTGFECHLSATIDVGLRVAHTQNIVIGEGVQVGRNVTIYNGVTLGAAIRRPSDDDRRYPSIEDDVTIYTGAKILGPIVIRSGAIVGANAVVLEDVPPGYVAVGVPARILPSKRIGKQ